MYPCAPSCSCSSWLLHPRCSTEPFQKIFLSLRQPDSTCVFPEMFLDSHLVDLLRLDQFMETAVHGINFRIRVWGGFSSIWKNSWCASQLMQTALWNKCWQSECVTQLVSLVTYVWHLFLLYPAAFPSVFHVFIYIYIWSCCCCFFFSTVAFFVSSKVYYFLNFIILAASVHEYPPRGINKVSSNLIQSSLNTHVVILQWQKDKKLSFSEVRCSCCRRLDCTWYAPVWVVGSCLTLNTSRVNATVSCVPLFSSCFGGVLKIGKKAYPVSKIEYDV